MGGCLRKGRERHDILTLKDILSMRWNTPELLFVSYLDPASTTTPTVQNAPGEFSDATERPLASLETSVRSSGLRVCK